MPDALRQGAYARTVISAADPRYDRRRNEHPWHARTITSGRLVGEARNESLVEAAGREVQGSGVCAAPVCARTRRCPSLALDRYGLAHDIWGLLADRSLGRLGRHIDQAGVLAFRGSNNRLRRVADACVDVVSRSLVGDSPRSAVRRSCRRPRWAWPCGA